MNEKVISLISGGIDSPLATLLASKNFKIIPINFCLYPKTSKESAFAAFHALETLDKKIDFEKTIIFPWTGILQEINKNTEDWLNCVSCRRVMLKTAEMIGEEENASAIITGESIGQKASQTIENIRATSSKIDMPVIRPLMGMDKNEIVKLSKEKNLFEENHAGCCQASPNNPGTKVYPDRLNEELEDIDLSKLILNSKEFSLEIEDFDKDGFESYLSNLEEKFG